MKLKYPTLKRNKEYMVVFSFPILFELDRSKKTLVIQIFGFGMELQCI